MDKSLQEMANQMQRLARASANQVMKKQAARLQSMADWHRKEHKRKKREKKEDGKVDDQRK